MKLRYLAILLMVLVAGCEGDESVQTTDAPPAQTPPEPAAPAASLPPGVPDFSAMGQQPANNQATNQANGQPTGQASAPGARTLAEVRKAYQGKFTGQAGRREPVPQPPAGTVKLVEYPSPNGMLSAYISPNPGDGVGRPGIVWINGGDCNSIGDVWSSSPPENDQTAIIFRLQGVVTMYPALRGGNQNPGVKEGFLGEVDDVIAAADFLAKQPYVDTKRIYLGGHSTGGTLVLLVAEMTDRFRGVFAFGPVSEIDGYGPDPEFNPFDTTNPNEVMIRSPGQWLASIRSPTWIIEGTGSPGNLDSLRQMQARCQNPEVHFVEVAGGEHFSVLGPTNRLIAKKIMDDTGPTTKIELTSAEAAQNLTK